MAKWEIHYRFGIIDKLWWKLVPGTEIEVPWPTGWTEPDPAAGGGFVQFESADPNDHYRPWLERHVGRQGWDWNWRLGQISIDDKTRDTIQIKIRRGRSHYATMALLRWQ